MSLPPVRFGQCRRQQRYLPAPRSLLHKCSTLHRHLRDGHGDPYALLCCPSSISASVFRHSSLFCWHQPLGCCPSQIASCFTAFNVSNRFPCTDISFSPSSHTCICPSSKLLGLSVLRVAHVSVLYRDSSGAFSSLPRPTPSCQYQILCAPLRIWLAHRQETANVLYRHC